MENRNSFACPICGNTDFYSIGILNGKPYCRKCISFRGKKAREISSKSYDAEIFLSYSLSEEQAEISRSLLNNFKNKKNSFVSAICGSPKTTNP